MVGHYAWDNSMFFILFCFQNSPQKPRSTHSYELVCCLGPTAGCVHRGRISPWRITRMSCSSCLTPLLRISGGHVDGCWGVPDVPRLRPSLCHLPEEIHAQGFCCSLGCARDHCSYHCCVSNRFVRQRAQVSIIPLNGQGRRRGGGDPLPLPPSPR